MSHNTVLINGNGQYQDKLCNKLKRAGHISAFKKDNGYVYWVGDASNAYQTVPYLKRFLRHVLFVKNRYFVFFDDLEVAEPHRSKFQWLYHFYPETNLQFNPAKFEFDYQIGATCVKMVHIASPEDLTFTDRQGMDGLVNPITRKDYRQGWEEVARDRNRSLPLFAHNLWISNSTPVAQHHFFVVIYPYREGESEPAITRLDDLTVRVESSDVSDVISFDRNCPYEPDIVVDYVTMRISD